MKGSYFLHLLLLVTLCVGQMASNAHLIGHLYHPANQHEKSHQGSHEHHHHTGSVDRNVVLSASEESDPDLADCSIYHAYIGLTGIAAKHSTMIASQSPCISDASPASVAASKHSTDWQPIRGPPRFS